MTLTYKGIGPIEYNGHHYWVMPASERIVTRWPGITINVNDKIWPIPTNDELHHVIYQNMSAIDAADTTISGSDSPSLANIGAATAKDDNAPRSTTWVWSSTEGSSVTAWSQNFSDGYIYKSMYSERWAVGIYKEPVSCEGSGFLKIVKDAIDKTVSEPKTSFDLKLEKLKQINETELFRTLTDEQQVEIAITLIKG